MTTRIAALVLALIAAPAFADFEPIPINHMMCYYGDGSVSTKSADYAYAYRGGVYYGSEPGAFLTTEPCIAHLPSQPAITGPLSGFIYCTVNPTATGVYYAGASFVSLAVGIWTWVETETGDVYVSSLPCELHIGFVPVQTHDGR